MNTKDSLVRCSKMLHREKQAELESMCTELEENVKQGNSGLIFQIMRTVASAGKKLIELDEVCQRWKEYCEAVMMSTTGKLTIKKVNHHL